MYLFSKESGHFYFSCFLIPHAVDFKGQTKVTVLLPFPLQIKTFFFTKKVGKMDLRRVLVETPWRKLNVSLTLPWASWGICGGENPGRGPKIPHLHLPETSHLQKFVNNFPPNQFSGLYIIQWLLPQVSTCSGLFVPTGAYLSFSCWILSSQMDLRKAVNLPLVWIFSYFKHWSNALCSFSTFTR